MGLPGRVLEQRKAINRTYRGETIPGAVRMPVTHSILRQKLEQRQEGIDRLKQRLERDTKMTARDRQNVQRRITKTQDRIAGHRTDLYKIERQKLVSMVPRLYKTINWIVFETQNVSLSVFLQDKLVEEQIPIISSAIRAKQDTFMRKLLPLARQFAVQTGLACATRVPGLGFAITSLIQLADALDITTATTDTFLRKNWDRLAEEVARASVKIGVPLRNVTVRGYVILARICQLVKRVSRSSGTCLTRQIVYGISWYFHGQMQYYTGYDVPLEAIVQVLTKRSNERILTFV